MIQAAAGICFPEATKPCPVTLRGGLSCSATCAVHAPAAIYSPKARSQFPEPPDSNVWRPQLRCYLLVVSPAPQCLVCLHDASPALCCVPRRRHFCMTSASLPFDFLAGLCKRKYLQNRGWKEKRLFPLHPHCLAPILAVVFSTASHQAASLPGCQALCHVP